MSSNNPPKISGALTYPVRNEEPVSVQPRQPRNLQGLLRFAMEATKSEDAPGNSNLGPMDEERRKFLDDALKSLTVSVAEVLQKSIKILADTEKIKGIQLGDTLPEDVTGAFNNLLEFIDDIDVANDFYKIGGFAIFPVCYGSENEEIRALAFKVLAELCQNNPFCQERALECGLLNILLHLVNFEQGSTLAKCILAISCVSRGSAGAGAAVAAGGCGALAAALRSAGPARARAAFLTRDLCRHCPPAREKFIELNIVQVIAEQIKSRRDETSEHLLSILHSLIESLDPIILQQCTDPSLDLKSILENHLRHEDLADDTFIEEKEYCQEILKIIDKFPSIEVVDNEADR